MPKWLWILLGALFLLLVVSVGLAYVQDWRAERHARVLAELWCRATYRTGPRPRTHVADGLNTLRGRRPHDDLEYR